MTSSHGSFIIAAYMLTAVVLAAMVVLTLYRHKKATAGK